MDKKAKEIADWTHIQLALDGKCEPNGCYCSYGHDGLRVVGPGFGPIRVRDSPEARWRFTEMAYGVKLEE